ncbi:hypothetical protein GL218_01448 [Daldinia childiae]|uniref:uncharacterized protein n=1 Tax=Daldinia childiae TaxID=326645 RepID=UPI001445DBFD|nr:uncharacterized protein GL218_01448 [Daldinia childiae]KAF3063792.1 hypothetical protein GL218_01448 [Daldinia childiae]
MADEEDEQRAQTSDNDLDLDKTDLSSEDGGSGDEGESLQVEWLATGREKRSTAGNRMKSMIAAEEPDDDLELLFAEDEDDAGFTDIEDAGSDVQMDSSSDEEDAQENGDELEGEKELEKRARESKQAARKRKAQEAIPVKFRKKVKIAPTPSGTSMAPEPKPRPKKKSERISWLPSPADMPTRASKRETTMLSKEQLHQQMIEREVKRLKQVEAMEKKAKRMEALKKPPMTQAQRLAEAVVVEKKNSKSLNRWEEAEKQREEERRAKLAALNNRTLDGPVVTFWSGVGEWIDGKLKHVGKIVTIEEKPAKKKRTSVAGHEISTDPSNTEDPDKPKESGPVNIDKAENKEPGPTSTEVLKAKESDAKDGTTPSPTVSKKPMTDSEKSLPALDSTTAPTQATPVAVPSAPPVVPGQSPKDIMPPPPVASLSEPPPRPQEPKPSEAKIPEMKAPDMRPPVTGIYTTSVFAPPQPSQLMKPLELKPPNTHKSTSAARYTPKTLSTTKSSKANAQRHQPKEAPPPPPPSPPANGKATRNCIILQNFNENAVKEKAVQNQILFGKDMAKLSKPPPVPRCIITNHPARYKDPKTGLPYYNAYAFREIQKLWRGEYRWSRLAGAWMGNGSYAATGVPARFLNPDAPGPEKKMDTPEGPKEGAPEIDKNAVSAVPVTPVTPVTSTKPKESVTIANVVSPPVATTPNQPMIEAEISAPPASTPAPAPSQTDVLATPSNSTPATIAPPITLDTGPDAVPLASPTPLAPSVPISATNATPMATGGHVNSEM